MTERRYFIGGFQIARKLDYPTLAAVEAQYPEAPAITELPDAWLVHKSEVTEAEYLEYHQAISGSAPC